MCVNWEAWAAIGSIAAAVFGIVAVFVSFCQTRKAHEQADKANELTKQVLELEHKREIDAEIREVQKMVDDVNYIFFCKFNDSLQYLDDSTDDSVSKAIISYIQKAQIEFSERYYKFQAYGIIPDQDEYPLFVINTLRRFDGMVKDGPHSFLKQFLNNSFHEEALPKGAEFIERVRKHLLNKKASN